MRDAPAHPSIVDDIVRSHDHIRQLTDAQQHALLMGLVGRLLVVDREGLFHDIEWAKRLDTGEEEE